MSRLALVLLAVLAPALAMAAPLQADLGQGLPYVRAHGIPAELPGPAFARGKPCVLDIRFAHGAGGAGALLLAWLKLHAAPRTPVFLLANAETDPELLAPLDSPDAVNGLVILGPAAPRFSPDIALDIPRAADRRAYAAAEAGASLDSLIVETIEKDRFDEDRLAREHLADSAVGDEEDAAKSDAAKAPQARPTPDRPGPPAGRPAPPLPPGPQAPLIPM